MARFVSRKIDPATFPDFAWTMARDVFRLSPAEEAEARARATPGGPVATVLLIQRGLR